MIKGFSDEANMCLYRDGASLSLPADIQKRAVRKLDMIDSAFRVEDLRVPPGNRLHKLTGDRTGQYAISINDKWRICFTFENGNAYDVEICDYHR